MILRDRVLRALVLPAALLPAGLAAQRTVGEAARVPTQAVSMDTTSLSSSRYGEATTLMERTIFRIDVARLRLRFGAETALALESLLAGARRSDELVRAMVDLAVQTRDAWASLTFQRDVGFDRFVDGIRDGVEVARAAGLLDQAFARTLSDSLPAWYGPLRGRGVRSGDLMMYRIRGDTLRTVFQTFDGRVMVDQVDVGSQPRLSVMGGFFAPGSDFRDGLLRSLLGTGGTQYP